MPWVQVETLQEESRSSKQQLVEACVVHEFSMERSLEDVVTRVLFFPKEKYQILEDLGRLKSHDIGPQKHPDVHLRLKNPPCVVRSQIPSHVRGG